MIAHLRADTGTRDLEFDVGQDELARLLPRESLPSVCEACGITSSRQPVSARAVLSRGR
jgi:hypothetical protein